MQYRQSWELPILLLQASFFKALHMLWSRALSMANSYNVVRNGCLVKLASTRGRARRRAAAAAMGSRTLRPAALDAASTMPLCTFTADATSKCNTSSLFVQLYKLVAASECVGIFGWSSIGLRPTPLEKTICTCLAGVTETYTTGKDNLHLLGRGN